MTQKAQIQTWRQRARIARACDGRERPQIQAVCHVTGLDLRSFVPIDGGFAAVASPEIGV